MAKDNNVNGDGEDYRMEGQVEEEESGKDQQVSKMGMKVEEDCFFEEEFYCFEEWRSYKKYWDFTINLRKIWSRNTFSHHSNLIQSFFDIFVKVQFK